MKAWHFIVNIRKCSRQTVTIPGTRSFHQFTPLSKATIATERVSEDTVYSLQFNFKNVKVCRNFYGTTCLNLWCAFTMTLNGLVWHVKLIHPPYPTCSYMRPRQDDVCTIETPLTTRAGRQYYLDPKYIEEVNLALWSLFLLMYFLCVQCSSIYFRCKPCFPFLFHSYSIGCFC